MSEKPNNKVLVLGLMSGTSLDGLDMALCEFEHGDNGYKYRILKAVTVDYDTYWKQFLSSVKDTSAESYFQKDVEYAKFMASQITSFLTANVTGIKPHCIASHGHTVFHQPRAGFSTQLGSGAVIAAETGITTVSDFRSLDVANGGQGAPLVPFGDKYLFSEYEACLNIGGIANISLNDKTGKRAAYDICEANMLLNYLAAKKGFAFDKGGQMARSGKADLALLDELNALSYYSQKGAKSLGREWFEKNIEPLFEAKKDVPEDLLSTATQHIASVIANNLNAHGLKNVFVTGGGAFNTFLIEEIKARTRCEIIIAEPLLINFKEALIFAFLGYLRINHQVNTLASVTGASSDSCGGSVYLGKLR